MPERSPVEILGAILDEVEGLRRTDPRSHLPDALIREARGVFDSPSGAGASCQLHNPDGLAGRTVEHVFEDDLQRGELVLVCTDGAFIVLEAMRDGDDAQIEVVRSYSSPAKTLADYLCPADQEAAGLISTTERQRLEHESETKRARQESERFQRLADAARKKLEDLEATKKR